MNSPKRPTGLRKEALLVLARMEPEKRQRVARAIAAERGLYLPPPAEPKKAQQEPSGFKIAPSEFDQRVKPNSTD